jgi:septal ring factor EnvC (AmiA/AmiB activator)
VLALLACAAPVRGQEAAEGGEGDARGTDLGRLRRAIAERREKVEAYRRRERGLFEAIEAIDRAARALEAEAARAGDEAGRAEARRRELEAERAGLEAKLDRTREALAERAVALYKAGALGPVPVLFAPGSLRDRLTRLQALRRLVDHDERLIARYDAERRALERAAAETAAALARRDEARALRDRRREELARERDARRQLLVEVRRDRARERAMLNELEAAARELERTLEDLGGSPAPPPEGAPFAARRGRLDAPVAGAVLRRFGRVVDTEYRTETFRKGVDFAVTRGEPVYAVADGTVRFAGWFRGYGRMVILDHGGGYFTVSGHLDDTAVEVGERLRAGDPVGRAGDTGSLSGPLLYFEIRQGSEALDPAEWLRLLPGG